MPSSPGDPVYARVAIVMAANETVEYECIHWYRTDDSPPEADAQVIVDDLVDMLDTALRDLITAVLPASCSYVGIRAVLHINAAFASSSDNTGANPGDLATDFQPPQVAVVLAKNSALGQPWGHGRFFWPLVPESLTTGFRLNTTGRTAYEALCVGLLADVTAAGVLFHPGHFSRKAGFIYDLIGVRALTTLKRQGRRELVPLFQ